MDIPKDSLVILNDDCLLYIFSYLNNVRERLRLQRVCKRFHGLIKLGLKVDPVFLKPQNILYPSEYANDRSNLVKFDCGHLLNICHNIVEFHNEILNYTFDNGLLGFNSTNGLTSVQRLFLKPRYSRKSDPPWSMDEYDADQCEFNWWISRCKRITSLKVYDFHIDDYILDVIPGSLGHLYLVNTSLDLEHFEKYLMANGKKLKSFSYSRQTVIPLDSDKSIVNLIGKYCANLEHIRLQLSHPKITSFGCFKHLSKLNIEGFERPVSFYDHIIESNPNLQKVEFICESFPDDETIARWRFRLPNLKKLTIEVRVNKDIVREVFN